MKKNLPPDPTPAAPRLAKLRLADLVPHPDQETYFRGHGAFEYQTLREDIRANGLKCPIEVLPPDNAAGLPAYTILAGHTRRKILQELDHESSEVKVRYDLQKASRAAVDEQFLLDNETRRHHSKLTHARVAMGLYRCRLAIKGRSVTGDPLAREDLRDQIGTIVGMSGRNLQRYLNVLSAPLEVQDAFETKAIKLVDAAKVANLAKKDQEALAARLRAGEDAKAVFADYFAPTTNKHVKPSDAVAAFVRALDRASTDLADRIDAVPSGAVQRHEKPLRMGKRLIRSLLARLDTPPSTVGKTGRMDE